MKNKNIKYSTDWNHPEPEFYMQILFEAIEESLLSISHRQFSNRGSGLVRHTGNPNGARVINDMRLDDVFEENKRDARIYHATYPEHIKMLGLDKKGKDFVLLGNGNLGNNFWHVAWEYNKEKRLYCLRDEPLTEREYSCFIVPKKGNPFIKNIRFDEKEEPIDEELKNNLNWCNYGQQIVRASRAVPVEEIVDQFYDVRHIFKLRDWGPDKDKDIETMNKLFENYPGEFRKKMRERLKHESECPRAEYYHSLLGLDSQGVVLYQSSGTIEAIAGRLVDKGVKDAIVLDQGGSVGTYASWLYPNGGFINASSYFRPERISTIAFTLK